MPKEENRIIETKVKVTIIIFMATLIIIIKLMKLKNIKNKTAKRFRNYRIRYISCKERMKI